MAVDKPTQNFTHSPFSTPSANTSTFSNDNQLTRPTYVTDYTTRKKKMAVSDKERDRASKQASTGTRLEKSEAKEVYAAKNKKEHTPVHRHPCNAPPSNHPSHQFPIAFVHHLGACHPAVTIHSTPQGECRNILGDGRPCDAVLFACILMTFFTRTDRDSVFYFCLYLYFVPVLGTD